MKDNSELSWQPPRRLSSAMTLLRLWIPYARVNLLFASLFPFSDATNFAVGAVLVQIFNERLYPFFRCNAENRRGDSLKQRQKRRFRTNRNGPRASTFSITTGRNSWAKSGEPKKKWRSSP